MTDDYYVKMGVYALAVSAIGSLIATVKTLAGIKPRLARVEKDVEDKLNKETFEEVKNHIDTKFEGVEKQFSAQGREIGEIKIGVNKLLERRSGARDEL